MYHCTLQNVLRAAKAGVIKSVFATAGSHLKVDQIIIEFDVPEPIAAAAAL